MEKQKQWVKQNTSVYQLKEGDTELAQLNVKSGAVEIKGKVYQIKTNGVFSQTVSLEDQNSLKIVELKPVKWYSQEYSLMYNEVNYILKVRNNPLAEMVIFKEKEEVLAYGIKQIENSHKIGMQIQEFSKSVPIELHLVMWYLFYPVALENCQDLLWILLSVA